MDCAHFNLFVITTTSKSIGFKEFAKQTYNVAFLHLFESPWNLNALLNEGF
jgi:hypothetical protein